MAYYEIVYDIHPRGQRGVGLRRCRHWFEADDDEQAKRMYRLIIPKIEEKSPSAKIKGLVQVTYRDVKFSQEKTGS